ncbi:MAG: tRNA dihydrouridine synthase DusB [bacterium]
MKIGKIDIGNRLLLAPMAEVSDAPFRMIAKKFSAGLTFTQMVSAEGVLKNIFGTLRLLAFSRSEKPIGVQFLGRDPEIIGLAVKEISAMKPDLIDLNCGCPVSKVVQKKMGASILEDPVLLGKIVRRMVDSSGGIPVSVKMRLGKDKRKVNIVENARVAEDNGASFIIVHARTRVGKYIEEPDWSYIKKVKEIVNIPVIGNGSVFTALDAKRMIEETGCDSVLVARGSLGNPFIFSRYLKIADEGIDPGEPSIDEIGQTAIEHLNLCVRDSGDTAGIIRAKKNIIWYFMYVNGINFLLSKIFSLERSIDIENLIHEHVENLKKKIYPESDKNEIHRKFKEKTLFWLGDEKEVEYAG